MDNEKLQQDELTRLLGEKRPILIGARTFYYYEPSLAVLDAMSKEWAKLPDVSKDLADISNGKTNDLAPVLAKAKDLTIKHAYGMSKSIAIAIIGEGYFKMFGKRRAKRLAGYIYRHITNKQLSKISTELQSATGLVDFMLSIRLMSTATTTIAKNRVE